MTKNNLNYFSVILVGWMLFSYQATVYSDDLQASGAIDSHLAIYEYIDPSGYSRSIDEISETAFINQFIAERYTAYETEVDDNINDKKGNHLAVACLDGELFTTNIIWKFVGIGEWKTTVLIIQRCYRKWYKINKKTGDLQFSYQKPHTSKTVQSKFTFTLKFKECRSGEGAFAAENCTEGTGYDRHVN